MADTYELAMEGLKAAALSVLDESKPRYFVRRGPIDWESFPFEKHPYAIAIQETDADLESSPSPADAIITLEVMTVLPELSEPATDDKVIYTLRQDARAILRAARTTPAAGGKLAISGIRNARASLAYDATLGVQGLTVRFEMAYVSR